MPQGCTLSQLPFIMTLNMFMHDAVSNLDGEALRAYLQGDLANFVYADGTLLLGSCDHHLQQFPPKVANHC